MKVAAYAGPDGKERVGLVMEDGMLDLSMALFQYENARVRQHAPEMKTMLELIQHDLFSPELFQKALDYVEEQGIKEALTVADYRLLAPIRRPPAIYALGRNYAEHARETGAEVPDEPIVFSKAPTAVIGPGSPVVYKSFLTRVDPEAELAVVLKKGGANIPEEKASECIAGYTCLNDVTARDIQKNDLAKGWPWLRSKGVDTFCPMGPWIVTPDEMPDPLEVDITGRVNGKVRQKDNSRNMIFKIPYIISWISQYVTLYPGDVITTGTPEGIAPVYPGDIMDVEIQGIGVLTNPVTGE